MRYLNQSIKGLTFFLFIVLISLIYGVCIQLNPIPPLNLLIWISFTFMMYKILGSSVNSKTTIKKITGYSGLLICIYFIYVGKAAYYVSYFNNIYLMESISMIPEGFQEGLVFSLLNPSIFIEKLNFLLSWDDLSLSLNGDSSFSFGTGFTNTIRLIEVMGILLSTYLWDKISIGKKSKH